MADRNQEIKARLLGTFRAEAAEHLQAITANLLALERGLPLEEVREVVGVTFREVHTLKGAARSVSLLDVEALCQALETVLSKITRGPLGLTRQVLDLLHEGIGGVSRLLSEGPAAVNVRELVTRLEQVVNEAGVGAVAPGIGGRGSEPRDQAPSAGPQPLRPSVPTDTIRIARARMDALLLQAEDLLAPKLAAGERVREAKALVEALEAGVRGQGLGQSRGLLGRLIRDERTITRTVGGLLEELRRLRLTPASRILDLFPRMVRDLAREHGKEVEWTTHGGDLEVDRKVLEVMKDPLIHLVRNAIDHGIELPEARAQAGKPPEGRLTVRIAALEGNQIELCVEDDGAGIDLAQVRTAAVRAHLLTAEAAEALPDDAVLELIFRSGVSTSPIITDVSGHGLGLAIVKERVEGLGGQIRVTTQVGTGTTVAMFLPATIATFYGLLVQAGGQPFLLPLEAVERAIRVAPEEVERVEGREAIRWNGQALTLARLSDLLGLPQEQGSGVRGQGPGEDATRKAPAHSDPPPGYPLGAGEGAGGGGGRGQRASQPPAPRPQPPEERGLGVGGQGLGTGLGRPIPKPPCVVVAAGEGRAALIVEEILGSREVLVKELRPPLIRVRNVAGAGLLGTGQIVLILRPTDLVTALRERPRPPAPAPFSEERARPPAILVVDDSITTRTMEKNLLEAAGYQVRVAVDGLEAWTILKTEAVDLVVSDVDMPRLDGFDLTARIRADQKLADLPVILVTVLESREYKERGIDVGANAYIVKSSFDQSNLLEIIRRLI
jgi:two-component system chemotaxis sensor kinase CheA